MEDLLGAELYEFPLEDGADEAPADDGEGSVQDVVKRSIERAIRYHEEHVEPGLVKATEYYKGEPFGDEKDGKSKVVSSDVRDATLAQLPSLLRVFFGSETPVEFRPRGPGDEPIAEQQTDYIRYIIAEDNPGFLTFHSAFKDALVRRLGIFKWWYDETEKLEQATYSGLGEIEVQALAADPSTEDFSVEPTEDLNPEGEPLFDVTVTRKRKDGRARIAAVPPEEFMYSPEARDLETASLVAHVREVPASDLIAMGFDAETIHEAEGRSRAAHGGEMVHARKGAEEAPEWGRVDDETVDKSQKSVLFVEAYALVDADDDGISELRLFQCVGSDFKILNGDGLGEIVDEVPFSILTPDPEPHTLVGLSNFDLLHDVQRVKSQVLRGTLDSLAESVDPRTEIVVGEVNMADMMNPDTSKVVRVTRPGMMREIKHTFVGNETLPVLAYYDEVKENRTGQSKAAQGLDADSLQSATKAAVAATLSASQQRLELLARVFAETGVKRLFKGLLRLVVRHQDQARVVRLRGHYVPVDPTHWDATMDVIVNVGLGEGTSEEKFAILAQVVDKQETMLQMGAPLVSLVEYRATLGKMLEMAGFKNADTFFKPWGSEQQTQYEQQKAQQPPPPDPASQLLQVEQMKVQAQMAMDAQKMELERWKAQMEDDRERDKMAREFELKRLEIEAKHQVQILEAEITARVDADRARMDADVQRAIGSAQAPAQPAQPAQPEPELGPDMALGTDPLAIEAAAQ